jgi:glycosyltransferase involved in cell wall biosynthesis
MSGQHDRIGPAEAEIVVFNKGGRDFRYECLERGEETPREFFYGFLELQQAGIGAAMQSTSGAAPGFLGAMADRVERGFAAITGVGIRPLSLQLQAAWFHGAKVAISYTDGFSLTLGLGSRGGPSPPVLIGGFHGLSDIEFRASERTRSIARAAIRTALARLDHAFFFGPADRAFAIENYGLAEQRSSVIPFGVDTEFWRPLPDVPEAESVVAVGQDSNRDYELLVRAPGRHPTRIVTRRKLNLPPDATHVSTSSGDYFTAESMTDANLRRLYNGACAVVVPLKDVHQPSGYSVTLQAMSCGKPVILSKIKGLWNRDLLIDGENCLLVPPGDAESLSLAIARVRSDADLRARLGRAARATTVAHFGLNKIAQGTLALAHLGLSLHASRKRAAA